jgi:hypothetical protein
MSKFQVGEKVQLDDEYNPDFATGVVTVARPNMSSIPSESEYKIEWDDGWVDDPEVYYYDSGLKKAE